MTVADLITFLQTQDPTAQVEVIEHTAGRGYYDQGGNAREVPFDPVKHTNLTDYTRPTFASLPCYGTKVLLLGSRE